MLPRGAVVHRQGQDQEIIFGKMVDALSQVQSLIFFSLNACAFSDNGLITGSHKGIQRRSKSFPLRPRPRSPDEMGAR